MLLGFDFFLAHVLNIASSPQRQPSSILSPYASKRLDGERRHVCSLNLSLPLQNTGSILQRRFMECSKTCEKKNNTPQDQQCLVFKVQVFEKPGGIISAHTLRMPCRAGVCAPRYSRFILEDCLACKRDPVAAERAVMRGELDRIQQLKFLDERASWIGFEFGQLFWNDSVSKMTALYEERQLLSSGGGRRSCWKVWMKRAYLLCQYVDSYSSRYVRGTSRTGLIVGAMSGKGYDAEPGGLKDYW